MTKPTAEYRNTIERGDVRFTQELFCPLEDVTLAEDLPDVAQHILKRITSERVRRTGERNLEGIEGIMEQTEQ